MATNQRTKAAGESITFLLIIGGILDRPELPRSSSFNLGRLDLTEQKLWSLSRRQQARRRGPRGPDGDHRLLHGGSAPALQRHGEVHPRAPARSTRPPRTAACASASSTRTRRRSRRPPRKTASQRVAHQKSSTTTPSRSVEGYRGHRHQVPRPEEVHPGHPGHLAASSTPSRWPSRRWSATTRPIGIVGGHEGPSLEEGLTNLRGALPTYDLQAVTLDGEVDQDLAALLVIGAESEFTETELRYIDQYVMRGGSLGVFGGGIKLSLDGQGGSERRAGRHRHQPAARRLRRSHERRTSWRTLSAAARRCRRPSGSACRCPTRPCPS